MSPQTKIKKVGLIGYGYWGEKLARVLNELGVLHAIVDQRNAREDAARETYPDVILSPSYRPEDTGDWDAAAIATPPQTHYAIAKYLLGQGKHVFCEKPLACNEANALELEGQALAQGLRLQVGHIFMYNSGLKRMPEFAGSYDVHVQLLNVGGAPSDSTRSLWWAGIPHAMNIVRYLIPDDHYMMQVVEKKDSIRVRINYPMSNCRAFIHVADYTGVRKRNVEMVLPNGTRFVFDGDRPHELREDGKMTLSSLKYRREPLKAELDDFLSGEVITDRMGSSVAKMIEDAMSLKPGSVPSGMRTTGLDEM